MGKNKQDDSEEKPSEEEEKKKQEEEQKPDEDKKKKTGKKKEDENSEDPDRLATLENKVDQLTSMVGKMLKKQENPEDPTDVDSESSDEGNDNMGKKKEEDDEDTEKQEEDDEDKKKEDEDEEDKKKADEGEPEPGEKEVKLPKAAAGETDVDDSEEEDEVDILEKTIRKMVNKDINRILKSKGITRSKIAPRPGHNIVKSKGEAPVDMAFDIIKKSKEGKINDIGATNNMIKKHVKKRQEHLQAEFNKEVM